MAKTGSQPDLVFGKFFFEKKCQSIIFCFEKYCNWLISSDINKVRLLGNHAEKSHQSLTKVSSKPHFAAFLPNISCRL